ncbi:MAG: hypothetical protein M3463_00175, partial [Verrucomicrobiota bacterium]|nr:hypothetical protein [Verrucomicrobiota bacterium]
MRDLAALRRQPEWRLVAIERHQHPKDGLLFCILLRAGRRAVAETAQQSNEGDKSWIHKAGKKAQRSTLKVQPAPHNPIRADVK